jgi:hypothetical protein
VKLQRNLFVTQDGVIVGAGGSPVITSGGMLPTVEPIDESSGLPVSDPYLPVKSPVVATPKPATNWYVIGGIFLIGYFLLRK